MKIPQDRQNALHGLPNSDIKGTDKVFPVRDVINKIISDDKYLLDNTLTDQQDYTLNSGDDWNNLNDQTVYAFDSLGANAPSDLSSSVGIVMTNNISGYTFQFVISPSGCAYRISGGQWNYLGREVPNGIDPNQLIDQSRLTSYFNEQASSFARKSAFDSKTNYLNTEVNSNNSLINTYAESASNGIASNRNATNSLNSSVGTKIESLNGTDTRQSVFLNSLSADQSITSSSTDSLNSEINGTLDQATNQRYGGIYGNSGMDSAVNANQTSIEANIRSINSLNAQYATVSNQANRIDSATSQQASYYASQMNSISEEIQSSLTSLDAMDYVPGTEHYRVNDTVARLLPQVVNRTSVINSLASTSYHSTTSASDIFNADSLSGSNFDTLSYSSSGSNVIMGNIHLSPSCTYQLTAHVLSQSENVSPTPSAMYEPILGTIGIKRNDSFGNPEYQELNGVTNSLIDYAYDSDNSIASSAMGADSAYISSMQSLSSVYSDSSYAYSVAAKEYNSVSNELNQPRYQNIDSNSGNSSVSALSMNAATLASEMSNDNSLAVSLSDDISAYSASYSSISMSKSELVNTLSNVSYIPSNAASSAQSILDEEKSQSEEAENAYSWLNLNAPVSSIYDTLVSNDRVALQHAQSASNVYPVLSASQSSLNATATTENQFTELDSLNSAASDALNWKDSVAAYSSQLSTDVVQSASMSAKVGSYSLAAFQAQSARNSEDSDFLRYKFMADEKAGLEKQVEVSYPSTNRDVEGQLYGGNIKIDFQPLADEVVDFISVPKDTDMRPPVFKDVELEQITPLGSVANTNSLLSENVDQINSLQSQTSLTSSQEWDLLSEYEGSVSSALNLVSASNNVANLNARRAYSYAISYPFELANSVEISLADSETITSSQVSNNNGSYYTSYSVSNTTFDSGSANIGSVYSNTSDIASLAAVPQIRMAITESQAADLSQNDTRNVYFYPSYENEKMEEAFDWCIINISPEKVKDYSGLNVDVTNPMLNTQAKVDRFAEWVVKILSLAIVGNIETVEYTNGGAVEDSITNEIEDWTYPNYLDWQEPVASNNSIVDYLNNTLYNPSTGQAWNGWTTFLATQYLENDVQGTGLNEGTFGQAAYDTAQWLRDKLNHNAQGEETGTVSDSDCGNQAEQLSSLLY